MKQFRVLPYLTAALLLIAPANGAFAAEKKSADPAPPQNLQEMNAPQAMPSLSGKVVETMDAGGYTYVNIENGGKKLWVAVTQMKVKVGQSMSFQPGSTMTNFTSKTLNRTFDMIVFSPGLAGQSAAPAGKPTDSKPAPVTAPKAVKVDKAAGVDAYTVAELYDKSAKLDKKAVVVKGQVVKFSAEIMGKNWIHLQDGSGDTAKGTNDMLVTTKEVAAVGDVITVKGTLSKDKDFGSGYKYAVIVEDASVKK